MFCKKCGSDKHWTLYCDKEDRNESGVVIAVRVKEGSCDSDGREANDIQQGSVRDGEGGNTDGGIGHTVSRYARWKRENKGRYNEYMKEYMRKRRKLLTSDK